VPPLSAVAPGSSTTRVPALSQNPGGGAFADIRGVSDGYERRRPRAAIDRDISTLAPAAQA
jgi:hypothetical protein